MARGGQAGGLRFREDVAYFQVISAGVFSVGALALLLWRLGFPAAGVIGAFLFVVHPWHIRYASELRAYSFMLFILPLCYVFLIEALDTGRWRWWEALWRCPFRPHVFERAAYLPSCRN